MFAWARRGGGLTMMAPANPPLLPRKSEDALPVVVCKYCFGVGGTKVGLASLGSESFGRSRENDYLFFTVPLPVSARLFQVLLIQEPFHHSFLTFVLQSWL